MKSTLKPFAPFLAKYSATFASLPYTCAQAIQRMMPTLRSLAYLMRWSTSTSLLSFQMLSCSLQPSSKITYSTPVFEAKSM